MINEKEIDYQVNLIQADIKYYLRYKNNLKKFCIDNRVNITKVNMNKLLLEIENIILHINNLKNQEQEYLKLLDTFYYGNNSDT